MSSNRFCFQTAQRLGFFQFERSFNWKVKTNNKKIKFRFESCTSRGHGGSGQPCQTSPLASDHFIPFSTLTTNHIWSAPLEHDMKSLIWRHFRSICMTPNRASKLCSAAPIPAKILIWVLHKKYIAQKKYFWMKFFFRVEKSFWKKSLPIFCMLVTRTSGGCHTSPK